MAGDNGLMTGRWHRLVAFFGKAEPRGAPSGWALALDAAIAVAAAVGAVMEVADRTLQNMLVGPGGAITIQPVTIHAAAATLAAAALTALPLAARRLYPIMAWLVIAAAITALALSPMLGYRRSRPEPPSSPPTARSCTAGTGTSPLGRFWPSPPS